MKQMADFIIIRSKVTETVIFTSLDKYFEKHENSLYIGPNNVKFE